MRLDFGNGIWADTDGAGGSGIGEGATGLDAFEADISMSENANSDGSSYDGTQLPGRVMVIPVEHEKLWTRREILTKFSPKVERIISTELGSMPYYVQMVSFPASHIVAQRQFTVVISSELALPEADTKTAEIAGAGWAAAAVSASQTTEDADTATKDAGETIALTAGQRVRKLTLKTGAVTTPGTCSVAIYATDAGVATGSPLAIAFVNTSDGSVSAPNTEYEFLFDWVAPASATYAFRRYGSAGDFRFRKNTAGGYASGDELSDNAVVTGDDLWFKLTTQAPTSGAGSVTFDADTDVPCDPVIACVLVGSASALVIEGNPSDTGSGHGISAWATTITHAFVAGDTVVVDARNHTVTINGVDAIDKFDRDGDWPILIPLSNRIEVNPACAMSVSWKPLRLALI